MDLSDPFFDDSDPVFSWEEAMARDVEDDAKVDQAESPVADNDATES